MGVNNNTYRKKNLSDQYVFVKKIWHTRDDARDGT